MAKNAENQEGQKERQIIYLDDALWHIEDLLRVLAQPLLEKHLSLIFYGHKQLRAYELTNGIRGARDIGELVGIGRNAISEWWQRWHELGIVTKEGNKYSKIYSLSDLMTMKNNKKWIFFQGEEEQKEE